MKISGVTTMEQTILDELHQMRKNYITKSNKKYLDSGSLGTRNFELIRQFKEK